MRHDMKISVSKNPDKIEVFRCRRITIRERLLRLLLGKKNRVTVIVPGKTVENITVTEFPENDDE